VRAGFGRSWAAAAVSDIGDGVALAAGPLLLASLTSDPALVAGAVFVQQLPWLLFALPAGVHVDRLDRRRLIVTLVGAFAILVLYARERLSLTEVGFGMLLAASAVGGITATVVAARLQSRFASARRSSMCLSLAAPAELRLVTQHAARLVDRQHRLVLAEHLRDGHARVDLGGELGAGA
jgi:MFS family permease